MSTSTLDTGQQLRRIPLKDLESAALTIAVQTGLKAMPRPDRELIERALTAAAFLHRGQTRENRGQFDLTAYVEHPLRNTLRLMRLGAKDPHLLAASLLHDVAEDCANEVAQLRTSGFTVQPVDPERARELTLEWIREDYGAETERIVAAVSNPLNTGSKQSQNQRREGYLQHVSAAVRRDPKILLVKVADFIDNAGSLHHNYPSKRRQNRAKKYLRLSPVLEQVVQMQAKEVDALLRPGAAAELQHTLATIQDRLSECLRPDKGLSLEQRPKGGESNVRINFEAQQYVRGKANRTD